MVLSRGPAVEGMGVLVTGAPDSMFTLSVSAMKVVGVAAPALCCSGTCKTALVTNRSRASARNYACVCPNILLY